MNDNKIRNLSIRILVVSVMLLFGIVAFLDLFEHPVEVIFLAIPLLTFQILILSGQSTKWILISGISTILVLLVEIFINIFYYHFFG